MKQKEYNALVATLTRPIYGQILEAMGSQPIDRRSLVRVSGIGSGNWLSDEFARLMQMGLVKEVGTRPTGRKGFDPMHYQRVEPASVELEAEAYATRKAESPRARKRKPRRSPSQQLRDLKRDPGDPEVWIRTQTNMLRLATLLGTVLPRQSLWECIPERDLEVMAERLGTLEEALEAARKALFLRIDDDERKIKIEQYLDTNGRTAPEAEGFRRLAAKAARNRVVRDA